MQPVVTRSVPAGLNPLASVLRRQGVEDAKVQTWMQRQQERSLAALGAPHAVTETA